MNKFVLLLVLFLATGVFATAQSAPLDFVEEGRASWGVVGGSGFHAAHPTLPLGSTPMVRNLTSGREVEVTVVGRIPESSGRIIDITNDAAQAIGLEYGGPVRVYFPRPAVTAVSGQHSQGGSSVTSSAGTGANGINIVIYNHVIPNSAWQSGNWTGNEDVATAPSLDVNVTPGLPDPNSGKVYRLMVGTWQDMDAAVRAFLQLRDAGFPSTQEYAPTTYRVYATGIQAANVYSTVVRLAGMGFREIHIEEQN